MKYVLSYGGGLNSSALLVWLVQNHKPLDLVVFADTGNEHIHTYEAVRYYKAFAETKGITFATVRGSLADSVYDYLWQNKIVPSFLRRDCTRYFKVQAIRRYLRKRFGHKEMFTLYIGVDYGEFHRVRKSDVQYIISDYPLVDNKIDRDGCKRYLERDGFMVPKKSGCWFCPFQTRDSWRRLQEGNPTLFKQAIALEENTGRFTMIMGLPLRKLKRQTEGRNSKADDSQSDPPCDVTAGCFL